MHRGVRTSIVSARSSNAPAIIPRRGTVEIAPEIALAALRAVIARARVSPEDGDERCGMGDCSYAAKGTHTVTPVEA